MTEPRGLVLKGTDVAFELEDGREIEASKRYGMLHDETGREWPARSVLVGPFRKGGEAEDPPRRARDYLGRTYTIKQGEAKTEIVPRALWNWDELGQVARIYYLRGGTKAPGRWQHPFNKRSAFAVLVKGPGKVTLYKWGAWYRLQLPRGAMLDSRGIVWP